MCLKKSGLPGICSVAVLALYPHDIGMNFWLFVAGHTFRGGAVEFFPGVAGLTIQRGMFSIQGEDVLVFKASHSIPAIMALHAGIAKLADVFLHKSRISGIMAVYTALCTSLVRSRGMAAGTNQRCALKIQAMMVEGE